MLPLYKFVPRRDNYKIWLPVVAALAVMPLIVRNEYILYTAVMAGIYIILTSSLNITNGYTGLFQFGHAAFYGIGAYTAAILSTRYGFNFLVTLPLGGIMAALIGAAIALPTLRLRGIFLALVTIGFQQITYLVIMNWIGLTRGPMGIPGIPSPSIFGYELMSNAGYYYLILVLVIIVIFLISRIVTSRVGRTFVAIREDELAAESVSIAIFRAKVMSFVIATFFAGIAGAFFAHHSRFVSADSFRLEETFIILTMLIVGGMGSITGPVIGAVFLVVLPEVFRFLAEYRGVVYGLIMIAVILLRPEGIAGVPGIIQTRGLFSQADKRPPEEDTIP
jgi:branched-chain amino acid transport system permease protein